MKNHCVSLATDAAAILAHVAQTASHAVRSAGDFNFKSLEFPVAAVVKQNSQLPNTVKCFQSKHVWLVIQFEIPCVKLTEIGLESLTDFP